MFVAQGNLMPTPRRERASTRPPVGREHPGAPRASLARRRDGPQVSRDRGWHKVALSPRQRSRDRALTCENGTSWAETGSPQGVESRGPAAAIRSGDSLTAGHQPGRGLTNEGYVNGIRKTFAAVDPGNEVW